MRKRTALVVFVGALVVLGAGVSLAGDVVGSGEGLVVAPEPVATQLPNGETYVQLENQQVLIAADPNHPFHLATITCTGSCTGVGGTMCAGGCTGQDPEGDIINFTWTGQNGGAWTLVGGTGKWQGSTGSGTWQSMGPMGSGFSRNSWKGSIRMR